MRSVLLLANAGAGRGRAARLVADVERRLRQSGCVVRVLHTPDVATAGRMLPEAAREVDVLAVVGGDGTVHSALPALAGTRTSLGIIPAGSGNDLAAALGIPADPIGAADVIATGVVRRIDLARAGERWWASVLCAGLDSAVAERAARMRWPAGPRRYDLALLAEVVRLRSYPFALTLDGQVQHVPATLVAVGNTPLYGGGLRICPGADPGDGLLDVTVVGPVSRSQLLRVAPRLRSGDHLDHPAVTQHRVRSLRLEAPGVTAYADGELVGALPLDATCVPGALQVVVPAAGS